jgi:hypothetical protein
VTGEAPFEQRLFPLHSLTPQGLISLDQAGDDALRRHLIFGTAKRRRTTTFVLKARV